LRMVKPVKQWDDGPDACPASFPGTWLESADGYGLPALDASETDDEHSHAGGDFDDFLNEEGVLKEVESRALKRALAIRVQYLMKMQKLTKSDMAIRMRTSRAAVDRLLDGDNTSVTLGTLNKAARALGRKVRIELVA